MSSSPAPPAMATSLPSPKPDADGPISVNEVLRVSAPPKPSIRMSLSLTLAVAAENCTENSSARPVPSRVRSPSTTSLPSTVWMMPAAAICTLRSAEVLAVSPLASSVAMAVTVRLKSRGAPAPGVRVRPGISPPATVQLPSPLSVPADRTEPAGRPPMVADRVSEPSVSLNAAAM